MPDEPRPHDALTREELIRLLRNAHDTIDEMKDEIEDLRKVTDAAKELLRDIDWHGLDTEVPYLREALEEIGEGHPFFG
jgi:hypothetical protein